MDLLSEISKLGDRHPPSLQALLLSLIVSLNLSQIRPDNYDHDHDDDDNSDNDDILP